MKKILQYYPLYNLTHVYFLLIILFEAYKLIASPEWESIFIFIAAIIGAIVSFIYQYTIEKITIANDAQFEILIKRCLWFGNLLTVLLMTLSVYTLFYKGLFGLYKLFYNFNFLLLIIRLLIVYISFRVMRVGVIEANAVAIKLKNERDELSEAQNNILAGMKKSELEKKEENEKIDHLIEDIFKDPYVPKENKDKSELTLKDILKMDFGVGLPISGGNGNSIENPIIIHKSGMNDYVSIEYIILDCLGKGRKIEWKMINQTLTTHNGRKIDKIKIETKQTTLLEIITQIENYYFDITECF